MDLENPKRIKRRQKNVKHRTRVVEDNNNVRGDQEEFIHSVISIKLKSNERTHDYATSDDLLLLCRRKIKEAKTTSEVDDVGNFICLQKYRRRDSSSSSHRSVMSVASRQRSVASHNIDSSYAKKSLSPQQSCQRNISKSKNRKIKKSCMMSDHNRSSQSHKRQHKRKSKNQHLSSRRSRSHSCSRSRSQSCSRRSRSTTRNSNCKRQKENNNNRKCRSQEPQPRIVASCTNNNGYDPKLSARKHEIALRLAILRESVTTSLLRTSPTQNKKKSLHTQEKEYASSSRSQHHHNPKSEVTNSIMARKNNKKGYSNAPNEKSQRRQASERQQCLHLGNNNGRHKIHYKNYCIGPRAA